MTDSKSMTDPKSMGEAQLEPKTEATGLPSGGFCATNAPSRVWLITGCAGFLGSHVVEHLLKNTSDRIIGIDKLSYATHGLYNLKSFGAFKYPNFSMFTYDLQTPLSVGLKLEFGAVTHIIHLAAETHVDNSIADPVPFVMNNISSTLNMLEYARELGTKLERFVYWSTDEIYGSAPDGTSFKEEDRQRPTNPYSASKSASEVISMAYANTYKVPVIITNCMNIFGERQHVEKFIPKVMKRLLEGRLIEIHCDPTGTIPGSRSYIHARNCAAALMFIIDKGKVGERYNIMGEKELNNLEVVIMIAKHMGITDPQYKLVNFHEDRPGHDLVYRLDGSKLRELGWEPPLDFEHSLHNVVINTLNYRHEWLGGESCALPLPLRPGSAHMS